MAVSIAAWALSATASMLFWAFLSWHLGNLARSAPDAIGILGWTFFIVQLAGVVLSFLYFHLPAMVLSGWLQLSLVRQDGWRCHKNDRAKIKAIAFRKTD